MDNVKSVNGKTGYVTLTADDIKAVANASVSVEYAINKAFVATLTAISGQDNDYQLTIAKRS